MVCQFRCNPLRKGMGAGPRPPFFAVLADEEGDFPVSDSRFRASSGVHAPQQVGRRGMGAPIVPGVGGDRYRTRVVALPSIR